MKILELQLKLQLTAPPEVREQRNATIKEDMTTLENAVKGSDFLFNNAMDLWDTLQEDPNLQRLSTKFREAQQRYDEIRVTTHILALVQCFTHLQEGNLIQAQVQELQEKESVLKAQIQPQT